MLFDLVVMLRIRSPDSLHWWSDCFKDSVLAILEDYSDAQRQIVQRSGLSVIVVTGRLTSNWRVGGDCITEMFWYLGK